MDELTITDINIFTTVQMFSRAYEFPDRVHLSISYEMDLNLHVAERTVYTFLDWLGDVGGLMGILFDFGGLIVMCLVGNALSYMLIKEVFKE